MIYRFDQPKCLNGWWDLCPMYNPDFHHAQIPEEGWYEGKYLVPSFYNLSGHGIMYGEDDMYHPSGLTLEQITSPECKNLFDTQLYPREWHRAVAVWVKRRLTVQKQPGKRYFLVFEAVGPKAEIFLNGRNIMSCREFLLPQIVDVTEYLTAVDNTLAVLIEDYDRSPNGRHMWPSGNFITGSMFGIWQDVYLLEKNEVYTEDVTVVTSYRKKTLSLRYRVCNASGTEKSVTLTPTVTGWKDGTPGVSLSPVTVTVPAYGEVTVKLGTVWKNPELWDAYHPYLYRLTTALTENGQEIDCMTERFGFREVWIEGKAVLLNGHPLHLFADWGHKTTCFAYTEGWIRKWFGMMKDYNLNASRLHTHPHPKIVMELADEYGIYIVGETGAHGSGGAQAGSSASYWDNVQRHAKEFIKRDKNNPCVVMWSCENEMRWNCDGDDHTLRVELEKLRHLFNREDPTRVAYHEGDTSLWNEKTLELISRHYEKEVSGLGWWDQTQPLHCGEMASYHYAGPNSGVHFEGDRGFRNYKYVNSSAAEASAYIVEDGRSVGVTALGQWNISCLMNLRRNKEHYFHYDDVSTPGIKPLYAQEGACEFAYWEDGKGYWDQYGSQFVKDAYRPFAVLDLSRRTDYLANTRTEKELTVVNDGGFDAKGTVTVGFRLNGRVLVSSHKSLSVKRGMAEKVTVTVPSCRAVGRCELFATYTNADGRVLDDWAKTVWVSSLTRVKLRKTTKVAVIGSGYFKQDIPGADYVTEDADLSAYQLLVIEKNAVEEGSHLNRTVMEFARRGGRVVVFEQRVSLFPGLKLEPRALQTSFFRAKRAALWNGIDEKQLRFWSDAPFSLLSGDDYVTAFAYQKDDGSYMVPLADGGDSGFGTGDLADCTMFESFEGRGLILSCQYLVTEHRHTLPVASRMIANLLSYAQNWKSARKTAPVKTVHTPTEDRVRAALEFAKNGGNAILLHCTERELAWIAKATGAKLEPIHERLGTWNAVQNENNVLDGVSDEDVCGIERFTYCPGNKTDRPIAPCIVKAEDKVESLLETCPESCIYSMWPGYGRTELLRAYTATKFCYGDPLPHEIVAGKIAHGKGQVVFSLFKSQNGDDPRLHRWENQLCRAFGDHPMKGKESPLAGDAIVDTNPSGKGYPEFVFISGKPTDAETVANRMEACTYQTERMIYSPILFGGDFVRRENPDGVFTAEDYGGAPLWVYYRLESPIVRKNFGSVDAIPDPGAQTFLDVTGEGSVELYINHNLCGKQELAGNIPVTFPDLELETSLNHILLIWTPKSQASTLHTAWRNIIRHPETGFAFTEPPQY